MTENPQATRAHPRVALVTCAELPDLEPDDRLLLPVLAARAVATTAAVWTDPHVDWTGFDLTVLRSPWDYARQRDTFVAWAAGVPRLVNPAEVVAWNTDKRYLAQLTGAGIPVVPTTWLAPADPGRLPDQGEWVIKPAVGAGSKDSGRYRLDDPAHRRLAAGHVERLQAQAQLVMVQPYLAAVETYGETGLVFLAGADGLTYSHAIRKGPLLTGPDAGLEGLYAREEVSARTASPAELALARRVLAVVSGGTAALLYARVDVIPGPGGDPLLVELELTEPSLFLGYAPGAADRFADAIARLAHCGITPGPTRSWRP